MAGGTSEAADAFLEFLPTVEVGHHGGLMGRPVRREPHTLPSCSRPRVWCENHCSRKNNVTVADLIAVPIVHV